MNSRVGLSLSNFGFASISKLHVSPKVEEGLLTGSRTSIASCGVKVGEFLTVQEDCSKTRIRLIVAELREEAWNKVPA